MTLTPPYDGIPLTVPGEPLTITINWNWLIDELKKKIPDISNEVIYAIREIEKENP